MNCPFCGEEMLHGYLHLGMALWSQRKHKLSLLPKSDESFAMMLGRPILNPHFVESDFCPKCQRMVLDTSPYPSSWDEK